MSRMLQSTVPYVFSEDNEDGVTKEVVAGDFEQFSMIIKLNGSTSIVPVQRDRTGFYNYGATLPIDADVQASR